MAKYFISRPILAWVVAILMSAAGVLAIMQLPVEQYPNLAMPQVAIQMTYPGASAETLSNTATQIIEQNMTGLDGLVYMSSTSQSSGVATITLTFQTGTDPNTAQMQTQNKLQPVIPLLPQEIQRQGVRVTKRNGSILLVVGLFSRDGSMNTSEIADYVSSYLKDSIARIDGVGEFNLVGAERAMRIWLDPEKLAEYRLTIADIADVVRRQNIQVSSGQLGNTPHAVGQELNVTIVSQSQLRTPEDFGAMRIRVNQNGSALYLRDVARVELGQENYNSFSRINDHLGAGFNVQIAPGANSLDVADAVKNFLEESRQFFPPGLDYSVTLDTTPFISVSIWEVAKTLIEAVILVVAILFLFLQNIRTTFIPSIAVPVVLLGSFAVLHAFGFSINGLTMLGMVLAIGVLVDDAIVVVENTERLIQEEKLSPKAAAEKTMEQLTGALVGTALVLVSVFLPMAFFSGTTGVIYRQFSITICSAMVLSIIVAIVLTPALCASMLEPYDAGKKEKTTGFFGWYNRNFAKCVKAYESIVGHMIAKWTRYILMYAALVVGMFIILARIPGSFLPEEDQGRLIVEAQLPVGSTIERTENVMRQISNYFLVTEVEAVESVLYSNGSGSAGNSQNVGRAFVRLRDGSQRTTPDLSIRAIGNRATAEFARIRDAIVYVVVPPASTDLGMASGFNLQLVDKAGVGHDKLMEAMNAFLAIANGPEYSDRLRAVRSNGLADTPQYRADIDQDVALAYGVPLANIHDMLQTVWGGTYINDFIDKGRTKRVYMQSDAPFRMQPEDFDLWYIRNSEGRMVPLGPLVERAWIYGSPRLERYNGMPSREIMGRPAAGVSTGEAMLACEEIMQRLDPGIGLEWTGLSLQERMAGDQALSLYLLSIGAIFLFLAALYESWTVPLSILLVIPIGIFGVEAAALLFGQANDVYFQIGFLTIVGLAAKNAILIVEFSKELYESGIALVPAVLQACRLRLRPIMMTVLTFLLGVLPLALSSGAGSGAQNAIGIGIVGGMVTNTIVGILYIPLFYALVAQLFSRSRTAQII